MKRILSKLKRIFSGTEQLTNRQLFSLIIYSVALVHFFLTGLFFYLDIKPLYVFNCISVLTYLFSMRFIKKSQFTVVYYITYTEIILHSLVATLCIGWQFGFAQYIIGIVSVGYYIGYSINAFHQNAKAPTINAVIAAVSFMLCRVLSSFVEPFYTVDRPVMEMFIYIFNSICTFSFLILFSMLFIFEIKLASAKLRHQNAILDQLANTDPLTGLYNRRSMNVFLEQALKSDSSFAVVMCDIDDFKKINDTYGHDFGDIVLQEIAQITTNNVNESGYVCRWGGEEILMLISNSSKEKTKEIAEGIRSAVDTHRFLSESGKTSVHCTLTLGVAEYEKGKTIEEVITQADYNLYCGKRNGKNMVIA